MPAQRTTSEWNRTKDPRGAHRIRLLIEDPSATSFGDFARFRAYGFEVAVCAGPEFGGCPLVRGEPCPLVEDADVVLWALDLDDPRSRAVLRTLRSTHPETPVVVRLPEHGFGKDELLEHLQLVPAGSSFGDQIAAIRRALHGPEDAWGLAVG